MEFNIERDQYEMIKTRDQFALAALPAVIALFDAASAKGCHYSYGDVAKETWLIADELMAARGK